MLNLETATDDAESFSPRVRSMGLDECPSTEVSLAASGHAVVGLGVGADGAPEGEIQKLTSSCFFRETCPYAIHRVQEPPCQSGALQAC